MGGLIAYWLATQSEFASEVVGLLINSGTTDLTLRQSVAADADLVEIDSAYGSTDTASFLANSVGHDPLLLPASLWDEMKVLQVWSTGDTTVVPAQHGQAWLEEFGNACAYAAASIRSGGYHGTATRRLPT